MSPTVSAPLPLARLLLVLAVVWPLLTSAADAQDATKPRQFAPGIMTTIQPELLPEETASVHPVVEFRSNLDLDWRPEYIARTDTLFETSANARFTRDIWCLEFSFKPLRMLWVEIPQPNGKMERKLIWYMVYSVRNTGQGLAPGQSEGGVATAEPTQIGPVRFLPHFVLQGHDQVSGRKLYRAYMDRIIPAALEPIRRRETPGRKLLSSAQMAKEPIPVSTEAEPKEVWGVAAWEDVDPKIDFFSIYVRGLTNAYRFKDPPGAFQHGDPPGTGRRFTSKTLQLNFNRPGDRFLQHEGEIRFGVAPGKAALYGEGVTEGLAHRWVYR